MQMVKNIFMGLLLVWFILIILMPKQELYYKLEQELNKNDIIINEKRIEEGLFSLTLYDSDVYIKGIKLATVKKIEFLTFLAYTRILLEELYLDDSLKSMFPTQIDKAKFIHTALNPIYVDISSEGSFGKLSGIVNLEERVVRVDFNNTENINNLKSKLQKDKKGWYYETSF